MKGNHKTRMKFKIVRIREENGANYALLKICFGKCERFLLYVEDGTDEALECVDVDEAKATEFFERLIIGGLAPCHLRDCIGDLICDCA